MRLTFSFLFIVLIHVVAICQDPIGVGGGDANYDCECYEFYSECSDEPLNFAGASVRIFCLFDEGMTSYDRTIGEDGRLCSSPLSYCDNVDRICLDNGNWEVCRIEGCRIYVYQTISQFPRLNGQLVGGGWITPGGLYDPGDICGGSHTGPLNSIHNPTDILYCPGEPMILTLKDLEFLDDYSLCLLVKLTPLNGGPAIEGYFSSSATGGNSNQVNLTGMFDNLVVDETYLIEFTLMCCSGEQTCTGNTYKYAYITIEGGFAYDALFTAGANGNGQTYYPFPTDNEPGPVIPDPVLLPGSPLYINAITFTGFAAQPNGTMIEWELFGGTCGSNLSSFTSGQTSVVSNNFSTGSIVFLSDPNICKCYRLEIRYSDPCNNGTTIDSYYFRDGDCPEGLGIDTGTPQDISIYELVENPLQSELRFRPVSGEVSKELQEKQVVIEVLDMTGKILVHRQLSASQSELVVDFVHQPGVYHYRISLGNVIDSGVFIKK